MSAKLRQHTEYSEHKPTVRPNTFGKLKNIKDGKLNKLYSRMVAGICHSGKAETATSNSERKRLGYSRAARLSITAQRHRDAAPIPHACRMMRITATELTVE
jgi:hypothetical protein